MPKDEFTHRNHLRAAWLYLAQAPLPEAAMKCSLSIQRYANSINAPEKFHLTLTLALMHIIAAERASKPADDWESFLAQCPHLLADAKQIVSRHYSDEIMNSEKARKTFVPPDREPLPS